MSILEFLDPKGLMRAAVVAGASIIAAPAQAGPINLETWYQFSFTDPGVEARGCDPLDPFGGFCIPSSGTPTEFLDAPAWTFVATGTGAILTVTDAFLSGDQFEIFDFGVSLGFTSLPGLSDCGDDPVPCLADPFMSHGFFRLGAGAHSITIVPTLAPDGGGSAYLLASAAVPEPATALLLGVGLTGLCWRRRMSTRISRGSIRRLLAVAVTALGLATVPSVVGAATRFAGPTSSQPLAITADDAFLVVANPDNNSVSFFDLRLDRNRRLAQIPVQTEPNGVAFSPDGRRAYVANTVSGTVSVMRVNIPNGVISRPHKHIAVGTEPYGLVLTPNGTKLYVANARSNSISVIDTATETVVRTINGVGFEPRGMAITNDGDDDDLDETLYVTQFLSLPIAGKIDGADDAKAGHVTVISTATDTASSDVTLNPIADTGFKANGDALARIPPGANFTFTTGAYPNQLNAIAIRGDFAFVPGTGASPNGPVRFNVNTQSLLSVIDRATATDAGQTINMHLAVAQQTNPARLFITQPWAMAFKHTADEGYVVSAASNHLVKVTVDPSTGLPAVQSDPLDPTRVLQITVGRNPRGIVVSSTDTRAYVMNYVSRDLSVINLTGAREAVLATVPSANLPPPGTLEDKIHIGKELYNTSIGRFDPPTPTDPPIVGRMSAAGWGSCASCHPSALSDNVTWIFGAGPRRTIPQHTDFDLTDPLRLTQRALNWSAIFDEEEDFELNIRGVSGGQGLIVLADGITPDPDVAGFTPLANGGRNQLKVRGIGAWDALKAFIQFGIRPPISPVSKTEPDVIAGKALFIAANCQQCHGGPQWTSSKVRFTPPPSAGIIVGGQIIGELRQVGTFDPGAFNEVRANAAPPLGADGFAPASLLSIFAFPDVFLHNGVERSLDGVLNNVTHRSAGTGGVDILTNAADRAKIVRFLQSIDAASTPIP